MRIVIETVPHAEQRYPTAGDWFYGKDDLPDNPVAWPADALQIRVSDTGNEKYNQLLAVHELVEALLCRADGVTQEQVDAYDKEFEAARVTPADVPGGQVEAFLFRDRAVDCHAEPGDQPDAPYAEQHRWATLFERVLSHALGVSWDEYDAAVLVLDE